MHCGDYFIMPSFGVVLFQGFSAMMLWYCTHLIIVAWVYEWRSNCMSILWNRMRFEFGTFQPCSSLSSEFEVWSQRWGQQLTPDVRVGGLWRHTLVITWGGNRYNDWHCIWCQQDRRCVFVAERLEYDVRYDSPSVWSPAGALLKDHQLLCAFTWCPDSCEGLLNG